MDFENGTTKATKSGLWDENEKDFLAEEALNFMPDDTDAANIKGKTVMKWDKIKRRYTLQKVDREGRVMREQRNESGKKIKKNDKQESIYKKWQQRTHLTLQKSGEKEDNKLMNQARNANESRYMMKSFERSHKDLYQGEDARSNKALIDAKGKKIQNRSNAARGEERQREKERGLKDRKKAGGAR